MALNIKNERVERLAEVLAHITGEYRTAAILRAVEERRAKIARGGRGKRGNAQALDCQETEIEIVPFTNLQWQRAIDAFSRFGKGRHPAALNFGDCMTYATTVLAQQPLLCRGDDFRKTDLKLV